MARYPRPEEGEWVRPQLRNFKMCCCDCGLVHRVDFVIEGKRMAMRAWRDERSTAQVRRWMIVKGRKRRS